MRSQEKPNLFFLCIWRGSEARVKKVDVDTFNVISENDLNKLEATETIKGLIIRRLMFSVVRKSTSLGSAGQRCYVATCFIPYGNPLSHRHQHVLRSCSNSTND